jgi:hypothetical protein
VSGIPPVSIPRIETLYREIEAAHSRRLARHGVTLPRLKSSNSLTQSAVALVGLYSVLGTPVTKDELTEFVRRYAPGARDLQEGRHLGKQRGWHVLSAARNDLGTSGWPRDSYGLMTVETPFPGWVDPAFLTADWETRDRATDALLNAELIHRSPEDVQKKVYRLLHKKFGRGPSS